MPRKRRRIEAATPLRLVLLEVGDYEDASGAFRHVSSTAVSRLRP